MSTRRLPRIGSVQSTVAIPGSKSDTHRALLLATQCNGQSTIEGVSQCDDTDLLVAALQSLGIDVSRDDDSYRVSPPKELPPYHGKLDLGMAGTSFRFLLPLVAATQGNQVVMKFGESLKGGRRSFSASSKSLMYPLSCEHIVTYSSF